MDFIARDQFNETVTVSELVKALELLGYSVSLEKKPILTPEQRKYATKQIFSEPEVLRQLNEAKKHRDSGFLDYYSDDEEEFAKLVDKVNGR